MLWEVEEVSGDDLGVLGVHTPLCHQLPES